MTDRVQERISFKVDFNMMRQWVKGIWRIVLTVCRKQDSQRSNKKDRHLIQRTALSAGLSYSYSEYL